MTSLTIGVIGAGKMGQMLLRIFMRSMSSDNNLTILASTASEESSKKLSIDPAFQGILFTSNEDIHSKADIVFLCVRPHQVSENMCGTRTKLHSILVSICAGVSLETLKKSYPSFSSYARCMPSITCQSSGTNGLYIMLMDKPREKTTNSGALEQVLKPSGLIFWVKPEEFDAATAIGASAPAFSSIFLEGLADGAVACGLSRHLSYQIGAQMLAGTAQLILEGSHPSELKDKVCTPSGCTVEGLIELESKGFRGISANAIKETFKKMLQLGPKQSSTK